MRISNLSIMVLAELKKLWNNKRQLLLLTLGPIILCILLGFVAYDFPKEIDITVLSSGGEETQQLIGEINKSKTFSVSETNSLKDAMESLDKGDTRAVIILSEREDSLESAKVIIDATDSTIRQITYLELRSIFQEHSRDISVELLTDQGIPPQQATQFISQFDLTFKTNAWKDLGFFDSFASAITVLIVLVIPLLGAVTAITSERSKGTIERIFASPFRRSEIIVSKLIAHSIFAIMVVILLIGTLKLVFDITLGNVGLILLITTLVGINAVIFGLLVSSLTYTEMESIFLGIAFMFLFMVLMGYMWPIETMHPVLKYVALLTPYIYGVDAIRHINVLGGGFPDVWLDLVILCGFIVAQGIIATQFLRRGIR